MTDLGLGRPLEYELGVCLGALELADRVGCSAEECSDVDYVALLAHLGCTGAARYFASWVGATRSTFSAACRFSARFLSRSEDLRYLIRRLADDRPLPERARLVAKMLVGGGRQAGLMAANRARARAFSPTVWACPTGWPARSGS